MKRMIIAGGRDFIDYSLLQKAVIYVLEKEGVNSAELTIISGAARGADRLGERYANEHNIKLVQMPADWTNLGKSAGYVRNTEMAKYAGKEGILLAFWDGFSKGTKHMIDTAKTYDLKVYVCKYNAK